MVTLEDLDGAIDVLLFPSAYQLASTYLTEDAASRFASLKKRELKTARAWAIKEQFRWFWTYHNSGYARRFLDQWYGWASRCRLEPLKRLGRTINKHLSGVLNGFQAGKHNGRVEAMNRALEEARARARGWGR